MPLREIIFAFLILSNLFCHAQESRDGYLIECEASESNEDVAFLGPILKNSRPQANTATINVTYSNFPSDAKDAFQAAVDVWQSLLISKVPIKITATWDAISSNTLATSGAKKVYKNFANSPIRDVWYPSALAESIAGVNLNGTEADIAITVNKNISWSFDTDGTRQAFKYDLMTVILHEIAHGLGFTTSMKLAGTNETQAQWGIEGLPLIYDIFSQRSSGQVLTNTAIIGNPSTQLKAAITSADVFFKISSGPLSKDYPKMYAPTTYRSGGTLSHLDESKYPKGTENSLMSPQIGAAEINHYPGQVILGILNQIGWGVLKYDGFVITATEPQDNSQQMFIYPNPSPDVLNVIVPEKYHDKTIVVEIFDMRGVLMHEEIIESQTNAKINIQKLPFGKYILRIAQNESIQFIKN
ncbi:T9SS C-terminal target domain-containing protein [Lacihabitans sp. CCS-44]|uniref:T9SS type A sorting domain-containing protein n=1 Tax=Lacihabitans sp. CCS-44 TaxID=2487331 RepID=UPI0020CFC51F|nr:T9SS type A sorting domain-containing protein [Lacihabitans sp. CCS-44]MCP9756241.1 T9SS C-terminal target domain-containing protein [Lacihabitans sp. CCS-44]